MRSLIRLVSIILALSLVFTLSSCDILSSFIASGQGDDKNSTGTGTDGSGNEKPDGGSDDNTNQKPDGGSDDNTNQKPDGGSDDNTEQKPDGDDKAGGSDSSGDAEECKHVYANNICINCGNAYVTGEDVNNCYHNWAEKYCMTCGARCDHLFNETTCEYCGYYSAGIDNPLTVCYMDTEVFVHYSASFFEILALHLYIEDVELSFINGSWFVETDEGRKEIYMYEDAATYGRYIKLTYVSDDEIMGGGGNESASFYYTVSIIDTPEYMPITIYSDEPLSGEQIIARAGVESPERFYIYVDISEYYELDNFKSMVFTYSCQIDFHLAG